MIICVFFLIEQAIPLQQQQQQDLIQQQQQLLSNVIINQPVSTTGVPLANMNLVVSDSNGQLLPMTLISSPQKPVTVAVSDAGLVLQAPVNMSIEQQNQILAAMLPHTPQQQQQDQSAVILKAEHLSQQAHIQEQLNHRAQIQAVEQLNQQAKIQAAALQLQGLQQGIQPGASTSLILTPTVMSQVHPTATLHLSDGSFTNIQAQAAVQGIQPGEASSLILTPTIMSQVQPTATLQTINLSNRAVQNDLNQVLMVTQHNQVSTNGSIQTYTINQDQLGLSAGSTQIPLSTTLLPSTIALDPNIFKKAGLDPSSMQQNLHQYHQSPAAVVNQQLTTSPIIVDSNLLNALTSHNLQAVNQHILVSDMIANQQGVITMPLSQSLGERVSSQQHQLQQTIKTVNSTLNQQIKSLLSPTKKPASTTQKIIKVVKQVSSTTTTTPVKRKGGVIQSIQNYSPDSPIFTDPKKGKSSTTKPSSTSKAGVRNSPAVTIKKINLVKKSNAIPMKPTSIQQVQPGVFKFQLKKVPSTEATALLSNKSIKVGKVEHSLTTPGDTKVSGVTNLKNIGRTAMQLTSKGLPQTNVPVSYPSSTSQVQAAKNVSKDSRKTPVTGVTIKMSSLPKSVVSKIQQLGKYNVLKMPMSPATQNINSKNIKSTTTPSASPKTLKKSFVATPLSMIRSSSKQTETTAMTQTQGMKTVSLSHPSQSPTTVVTTTVSNSGTPSATLTTPRRVSIPTVSPAFLRATLEAKKTGNVIPSSLTPTAGRTVKDSPKIVSRLISAKDVLSQIIKSPSAGKAPQGRTPAGPTVNTKLIKNSTISTTTSLVGTATTTMIKKSVPAVSVGPPVAASSIATKFTKKQPLTTATVSTAATSVTATIAGNHNYHQSLKSFSKVVNVQASSTTTSTARTSSTSPGAAVVGPHSTLTTQKIRPKVVLSKTPITGVTIPANNNNNKLLQQKQSTSNSRNTTVVKNYNENPLSPSSTSSSSLADDSLECAERSFLSPVMMDHLDDDFDAATTTLLPDMGANLKALPKIPLKSSSSSSLASNNTSVAEVGGRNSSSKTSSSSLSCLEKADSVLRKAKESSSATLNTGVPTNSHQSVASLRKNMKRRHNETTTTSADQHNLQDDLAAREQEEVDSIREAIQNSRVAHPAEVNMRELAKLEIFKQLKRCTTATAVATKKKKTSDMPSPKSSPSSSAKQSASLPKKQQQQQHQQTTSSQGSDDGTLKDTATTVHRPPILQPSTSSSTSSSPSTKKIKTAENVTTATTTTIQSTNSIATATPNSPTSPTPTPTTTTTTTTSSATSNSLRNKTSSGGGRRTNAITSKKKKNRASSLIVDEHRKRERPKKFDDFVLASEKPSTAQSTPQQAVAAKKTKKEKKTRKFFFPKEESLEESKESDGSKDQIMEEAESKVQVSVGGGNLVEDGTTSRGDISQTDESTCSAVTNTASEQSDSSRTNAIGEARNQKTSERLNAGVDVNLQHQTKKENTSSTDTKNDAETKNNQQHQLQQANDTSNTNQQNKKNTKTTKRKRKKKTPQLAVELETLPEHLKKKTSGPGGTSRNARRLEDTIIDVSKVKLKSSYTETTFVLSEDRVDQKTYRLLNRKNSWVCTLCGRPGNLGAMDVLFGPYKIDVSDSNDNKISGGGTNSNNISNAITRSPNNKNKTTPGGTATSNDHDKENTPRMNVWLHRDCAVWTSNICLANQTLRGLGESLNEAALTVSETRFFFLTSHFAYFTHLKSKFILLLFDSQRGWVGVYQTFSLLDDQNCFHGSRFDF